MNLWGKPLDIESKSLSSGSTLARRSNISKEVSCKFEFWLAISYMQAITYYSHLFIEKKADVILETFPFENESKGK